MPSELWNFILGLAESGWQISVFSAKFIIIFQILFSYFRFKTNFIDVLRYSFRQFMLVSAPYFISAIFISALLNLYIKNEYISSALLVIPALYLIYRKDLSEGLKEENIRFSKIKEISSLFVYILAFITAFLALSGNLFLNQLSALFYLGILFWTL
jgi:hypothetical protein